MGSDQTQSRRDLLRHVVIGGGVAVLGGVSGVAMADKLPTLASGVDLEIFSENLMESSTFELESAWKLPERQQTIPKGQDAFPSKFESVQVSTLPFGEMKPGASGNVLGAFRLYDSDAVNQRSVKGIVDMNVDVSSTNPTLTTSTSFKTWKVDSWEYPTENADNPIASGMLDSISDTPLLSFGCAHAGGFGIAYDLPAPDDSALQRITPDDRLTINLTLTARQCSSRNP